MKTWLNSLILSCSGETTTHFPNPATWSLANNSFGPATAAAAAATDLQPEVARQRAVLPGGGPFPRQAAPSAGHQRAGLPTAREANRRQENRVGGAESQPDDQTQELAPRQLRHTASQR